MPIGGKVTILLKLVIYVLEGKSVVFLFCLEQFSKNLKNNLPFDKSLHTADDL
jgi:hypothetical protein